MLYSFSSCNLLIVCVDDGLFVDWIYFISCFRCPFKVTFTCLGSFLKQCCHLVLAALECFYYLLLSKKRTGLGENMFQIGIRTINHSFCLGGLWHWLIMLAHLPLLVFLCNYYPDCHLSIHSLIQIIEYMVLMIFV